MMYSLDELVKGLKNPSFIFREANRQFADAGWSDGISVFDEDWDNLVILDACRYDVFAEENTLDGDLSRQISRGSATKEWVKRNFSTDVHRDLYDTVYVSANGWYEQLRDEMAPLHAAVWLYSEEYRNKMGTVEPKIVTNAALEAGKEYPEKRIIAHYVQPHAPYIGETAERYFEHAQGMNMVDMMDTSDGTTEDLRIAYRETLREALPEVKRLVDGLSGKTVVTSDHGELLGDRYWRMPLRNYGHPVGIRVPELREVPWLVCPYDRRKNITASQGETPDQEVDEKEVEAHLKSMGYL